MLWPCLVVAVSQLQGVLQWELAVLARLCVLLESRKVNPGARVLRRERPALIGM